MKHEHRLMTLARGREQGLFDRAIDVQVSRLRKLVEPEPASPRYLQTVWVSVTFSSRTATIRQNKTIPSNT